MSDLPFNRNRSMSRDKLKLILFDWLKEKGILGELQVFLRMKMVEKLQGTELTVTKHNQFSAKDGAINKVIYDYLKHHHMYYTMSVFASECSSVQASSLDNTSEDILNSLGFGNTTGCDDRLAASKFDGTTCLLNWIVDTLRKLSNKKSKSKTSQCDVENNSCKLMLNSQSQTDPFPKLMNTQSAQTTPATKIAETQTDEQSIHCVSADLNEEILQLKNKLEKSQAALALCQTKLQESEDKLQCLLANRNERFLTEDNPLVTQSRPAKYIIRNQTFCQKRVQEAFRFINHLDGRLQFLDQKYEKVAGADTVYDNSRFLSDQNVLPFSYK